MFSGMRDQWRRARATELRKEVEDSIARLARGDDVVNVQCIAAVDDGMRFIGKEYGSLSNVSQDGKRELAKAFQRQARSAFNLNMGKGFGLALLSAHIEAQVLPGDDARLVERLLTEFLGMAIDALDASGE